jgi:hypothetical protein
VQGFARVGHWRHRGTGTDEEGASGAGCARVYEANAAVALRLGTSALGRADEESVWRLCEVLLATFRCREAPEEGDEGDASTVLIEGLCVALGCVLRRRPPCFADASRLKQRGERILQRAPRQRRVGTRDKSKGGT